MILLFPANPLKPRDFDPVFEKEVAATSAIAGSYAVVDYDALISEDNPARAVRYVAEQEPLGLALLRGWMLTPAQYNKLYQALAAKGLRLVNDPAQYRHCHYLPEWYPALVNHTPKSVWLALAGAVDFEQIMALLKPFGDAPVIVKDYVKSRKHEWAEACFIPTAADAAAVKKIVSRFIELQGDNLAEGLVFREFVNFETIGKHSKSGMLLAHEYRLFFADGKLLHSLNYWAEGSYSDNPLPLEHFTELAQKINNRFFTMDVAKLVNGGWLVVEFGDGQVAGLPANTNYAEFYRRLADHFLSLRID